MKYIQKRILTLDYQTYAVMLFVLALLFVSACKKNDYNNDNNTASTKVDIKMIADGLVSPLGVIAYPDNTNRLLVFDQVGKIWGIDSSGNKSTTPFLDLSSSIVSLNAGYDER